MEVDRCGGAGDDDVALAIENDAAAVVLAVAAEVGGKGEHGVDHQLLGAIVAGELEADLIAGGEDVAAVDDAALAVDLLIDDRLVLDDFARSKFDDEVPRGVNAKARLTLKAEADLVGIGAEHEVVFELALVAVIDEVNARGRRCW